jgi:NTE family protein
MKLGIALGSGSARAWSHIGVLRALAEHGIRPDVVAGASAGALVGAAYASNQLDELESWARELTKTDVWRLLDATFGGGGVMRGDRLMAAVAERLNDLNIGSLAYPFAAVAADLYTGKEVWLREGSMLDAVRASSGLPGLFTPVRKDDHWLIDGGVVNPVPVSLCRVLGADYIIAVNLNQSSLNRNSRTRLYENDDAPEQKPERITASEPVNRWIGALDEFLNSRRTEADDREPGLIEVMSATINIMQDHITRSRMGGDPPDLVISPRLHDFQMMDFHRAREAIEHGYLAVQRVSPALSELV